jgi:hypothetical protein
MTRRLHAGRYGGVGKPPEPGSSGTTRAPELSTNPADPGNSR